MDPREERARQRAVWIAVAFLCAGACAAFAFGLWRGGRRAAPAPAPTDRAVAATDVIVDTARVQLHPCVIRTVSFRSRDEGWVTDACGHAFHTTDGGLTFEPLRVGGSLALTEPGADGLLSDEVGRIEWLSDRRALAFADDGESEAAMVLTSTDAGATWRRRPLGLPGVENIGASDHVDQAVWACGTDGAIIRSRDGGASFARTRHTPFNDDNRCMMLSFVDGRHGWAGGMEGKLHETFDGGDSWQPLTVPVKPRPTSYTTLSNRPVFDLSVSGVALVSAREGWVAMSGGTGDAAIRTFTTRDGGRTWIERKPPPAIAARLGHGGRWGDGAVTPNGMRLAFHSGAALVRDTRLVARRGAPAPEIIRGREPLEPGHIAAWTDHAIIETFDDGRSWSTLARVKPDQRIRRAVHPLSRDDSWTGSALVELADGGILIGWDELRPSPQPEYDRFRMAMAEAHLRGAPTPPGPLDCLASSASGSIDIDAGVHGCYEAREESFRLVWSERASTLSLPNRTASVPLGPAARRELLAAIAAAVQRPDDADHGCTTQLSIDLTWRCGAAARPVHASFSESDCGSLREGPEIGPAHRVAQAIQRAVARSSGPGK